MKTLSYMLVALLVMCCFSFSCFSGTEQYSNFDINELKRRNYELVQKEILPLLIEAYKRDSSVDPKLSNDKKHLIATKYTDRVQDLSSYLKALSFLTCNDTDIINCRELKLSPLNNVPANEYYIHVGYQDLEFLVEYFPNNPEVLDLALKVEKCQRLIDSIMKENEKGWDVESLVRLRGVYYYQLVSILRAIVGTDRIHSIRPELKRPEKVTFDNFWDTFSEENSRLISSDSEYKKVYDMLEMQCRNLLSLLNKNGASHVSQKMLFSPSVYDMIESDADKKRYSQDLKKMIDLRFELGQMYREKSKHYIQRIEELRKWNDFYTKIRSEAVRIAEVGKARNKLLSSKTALSATYSKLVKEQHKLSAENKGDNLSSEKRDEIKDRLQFIANQIREMLLEINPKIEIYDDTNDDQDFEQRLEFLNNSLPLSLIDHF